MSVLRARDVCTGCGELLADCACDDRMDVRTWDRPRPGEELLDLPRGTDRASAGRGRTCLAGCGREVPPGGPPGTDGYCSPGCWRRNNGLATVRLPLRSVPAPPAPELPPPAPPAPAPASRLVVTGREWCPRCRADHAVYTVTEDP